MVDRLKANSEQCRRVGANDGNQWQGDSYCDWLIKPRIRIPSNVPYENENLEVCKIKVFKQDGTTVLKETILKAKYFKDDQHPYTGQYIEEFYWGNDPVDLKITHQDWATGTDQWAYKSRCNKPVDDRWTNKADIQVYWYGNCDMWIDYVRVDNDVADELLGSGNPSYGVYDQWIKDESTSGYMNILVINPAEFELNNLPCIKYVEKKMKEYSNGRFKMVEVR